MPRPASYQWNTTNALASGVTVDEIVGVLVAVAPIVGVGEGRLGRPRGGARDRVRHRRGPRGGRPFEWLTSFIRTAWGTPSSRGHAQGAVSLDGRVLRRPAASSRGNEGSPEPGHVGMRAAVRPQGSEASSGLTPRDGRDELLDPRLSEPRHLVDRHPLDDVLVDAIVELPHQPSGNCRRIFDSGGASRVVSATMIPRPPVGSASDARGPDTLVSVARGSVEDIIRTG